MATEEFGRFRKVNELRRAREAAASSAARTGDSDDECDRTLAEARKVKAEKDLTDQLVVLGEAFVTKLLQQLTAASRAHKKEFSQGCPDLSQNKRIAKSALETILASGDGGDSGDGDGGAKAHRRLRVCQAEPIRASDFSADKDAYIAGVGSSFSHELLKPDTDALQAFKECFGPVDFTADAFQRDVRACEELLKKSVTDTHAMCIVHETKQTVEASTTLRVQNDHLDPICDHLGWRTSTDRKPKSSLAHFKCGKGAVTEGSEPDAVMFRPVVHKNVVGAIESEIACVGGTFEAKSTKFAANVGLRQGFGESTNVALRMRKLGIPCMHVRVLNWATNGQQVKLGVTRMLEPACPYLTHISKTLDLTDHEDRHVAAQLLVASKQVCQTPLTAWSNEKYEDGIAIDEALYHLKDLRTVFCVEPEMNRSLVHTFRLMALLVDSPAKEVAEVPITVYTGQDTLSSSLVFHNLGASSYAIGAPTDAALHPAYLEAVDAAVKLIHEAGVVHMDLYPSNIMSRVVGATDSEDGEVIDPGIEVKIVDWDAAHALNAPLTDRTRDRISKNSHRTLLVDEENRSKATPEWDTSLVQVLHWALQEPELCPKMCVTEKSALDTDFLIALGMFAQRELEDGQ